MLGVLARPLRGAAAAGALLAAVGGVAQAEEHGDAGFEPHMPPDGCEETSAAGIDGQRCDEPSLETSAANAAEAGGAEPEARWRDTLVVSASRLGAADHRVFVLDEAELATVGEPVAALRALPGTAVAGAGGRGALTQLRVRGAEANHLLVLMDGVPLNDPAAGSAFNFGLFDLAGVGRLEYLGGPQSAVWGADALAGVLYLDTRPRAGGRRLALAYGTDAATDADLHFAHHGARNQAALAASWARGAGTNAAREGDEADGFANATANLHLGTNVGAWQLTASGRWTDAAIEFDPSPPPRYVPVDGDRRSEDRFALLQGTARYLGHPHLTPWLTVASLRTHMGHFADGTLTNTHAGRRDLARAAANVIWGRPGDAGEAPHRLNFIAEAEREVFAQTGAPSWFEDPNQRQRMTTLGIGGEYQLGLQPFTLAASVRQEWNDAFADALAYRLGVTTHGRLRFFASVGRGVKNPTFTERFGYTPNTFLGNPRLRPETGRSVEAGIEWRWRDGSLSVAAFDSALHHEIDGFAFVPAQGGFTARNLAGESRRRGGEARLAAAFGRWQLRGGYAYVDAEDGGGRRELRRPRHLANLSLRARLARQWAAGFALAHASAAVDQDFGAFPARLVRLAGFRLLRMDVDYAPSPRWRLRLMADNVLDADAVTTYGYRAPGRSAWMRAELKL